MSNELQRVLLGLRWHRRGVPRRSAKRDRSGKATKNILKQLCFVVVVNNCHVGSDNFDKGQETLFSGTKPSSIDGQTGSGSTRGGDGIGGDIDVMTDCLDCERARDTTRSGNHRDRSGCTARV